MRKTENESETNRDREKRQTDTTQHVALLLPGTVSLVAGRDEISDLLAMDQYIDLVTARRTPRDSM